MSETNPLTLVESLKTVLRRYIATTLPVSRRYPNLAQAFRDRLAVENIVEGPYIEALPDFEKGRTLHDLVRSNGGFLNDSLAELPTAKRALHLHQDRAIELAARDGKSLLVATGTGSGKTETFLYPIAHSLLEDPASNEPGVRALLIYPMNALANDQLYYRIAPLFARYLKEHEITFGRYTGQIKANTPRQEEEQKLLNNDKLMRALGSPDRIPRNWLLTREEMLETPPKVLITNYAMLEHLLLLPRNERLFASNALRMIVLDEIHSYSGAQATEVAFLLRKLKNRLGIQTSLQTFGTSASLADGADADIKLKEFASALFGEVVEKVVRGKRIPHGALMQITQGEFSFGVEDWSKIGRAIELLTSAALLDQTVEYWCDLITPMVPAVPRPEAMPNEHVGPFLQRTFVDNREIRRVVEFLDQRGVQDFRELANFVFDSPVSDALAAEVKYEALSAVVRMGMLARSGEESFPLLPGRYHIAVNGIEGIAVRLKQGGEGWADIKVARQYRDPTSIYYALLVCRRCGQPYVEGYKESGYLRNTRSDHPDSQGERHIFWLGDPPSHHTDDESDDQDESTVEAYKQLRVNPQDGNLFELGEEPVTLYAVQAEHEKEEKAWYVKKCPACGSRASGADAEILTRMHPGNEAMGSVVTQRVLEALPAAEIDHTRPRPALGRSLLTFSDNRQDAAFFAPYFERTSSDLALRSAVNQILKERSEPIDLRRLASEVCQLWNRESRQAIMIDAEGAIRTDRVDVERLLLGALGAEFCTPGGRRNSLEALGVVSVTYDAPRIAAFKKTLRELWPESLNATEQNIEALAHILLESVRREKALGKFYDIDLMSGSIWGASYAQHRTFELQASDPQISNKWLPPETQNRNNRRTWYLVEQLGLLKPEAFALLRTVWDSLSRPPLNLMLRRQPGLGLDGEAIRVVAGHNRTLFVCAICGLLQQHVVINRCTAFGCHGEVSALSIEDRRQMLAQNHYLASYEEPDHLTVRAREHTASLSTNLRETIEEQFAQRQVNVLSCTTTMEMGVDLGDLEAVVNLNVPPSIANYQQRTGRAGRRAQAAPFCVTVARNTQYDQGVFKDFQNYLKATPGVPFIHLDNAELFWRHQQSILLAHFMRERIQDKNLNAPSLVDLFGAEFGDLEMINFREALLAWLEGEKGKVAIAEAEGLRERLPSTLKHIASTGPFLRSRFVEGIQEFAAEVSERWQKYTEKMSAFGDVSDFSQASRWQRMREEFLEQYLVTQFSVRGLIPTYSFPVHSLTLEVTREERGRSFSRTQPEIALSRDASMGISEYAPGAEVIANGRIWTSAGLAHYPKMFMPERWYVACPECFHVDIGDTKEDVSVLCGNCGSNENRRRRKFIEPHGFVTSYGDRKGRDPGVSRRRVKPADEAKLIASPRDEHFEATELAFLRTALLRAQDDNDSGIRGSMFIANRGIYGEGYYRCGVCNYSAPKKPALPAKEKQKKKKLEPPKKLPHDDPMTGQRCKVEDVSLFPIDLVHRFDTDVRLFRFLKQMPDPPESEISPRQFFDRFARTLAEGVRFAAATLLDIQSSGLRATYRLYGGHAGLVEVVLYDTVPGGAGYCARLGEPRFTVGRLFSLLRDRLACPMSCTNGCRQCLCDYSNQRYWDTFERTAVKAWLEGLLEPEDVKVGPGDFVVWKSPSLSGLSERLANYDAIYFVARRLIGAGPLDQESLNAFLSWLQGGKRLHIFLAETPEKKPSSSEVLSAYRFLHPYVASGQLVLYTIADAQKERWNQFPRIFTGAAPGNPMFREPFPVSLLLEGLITAPMESGVCDDAWATRLGVLGESATRCATDTLKEGESMQMWELAAGQPRDISQIFRDIAGQHVSKLIIRDPFCGLKKHRGKLQQFIGALKTIPLSLDKIEVHCREQHPREEDREFIHDIERHVDSVLKAAGLEKRDVFVQGFRQAARKFHDREIDIETIDGHGCSTLHRYFLTGGVDYLVDIDSQTRVFYYQRTL